MRIVLDVRRIFDWIVANMKTKFFAALAGLVIVAAAGCISTVSGTKTPALTWSRDSSAAIERTVDQVYQASVAVIQNNGVLVTEFIPHDTTNTVRSLYGKVNQHNVWIRVEAISPKITQVTVQCRSTAGVSDVYLGARIGTRKSRYNWRGERYGEPYFKPMFCS